MLVCEAADPDFFYSLKRPPSLRCWRLFIDMNLQSDDFELFALPRQFAQERSTIDARWKELQREAQDRKSTRLNSSHLGISYAVFCLKKKKKKYEIQSLRHNVCHLMIHKKRYFMRHHHLLRNDHLNDGILRSVRLQHDTSNLYWQLAV